MEGTVEAAGAGALYCAKRITSPLWSSVARHARVSQRISWRCISVACNAKRPASLRACVIATAPYGEFCAGTAFPDDRRCDRWLCGLRCTGHARRHPPDHACTCQRRLRQNEAPCTGTPPDASSHAQKVEHQDHPAHRVAVPSCCANAEDSTGDCGRYHNGSSRPRRVQDPRRCDLRRAISHASIRVLTRAHYTRDLHGSRRRTLPDRAARSTHGMLAEVLAQEVRLSLGRIESMHWSALDAASARLSVAH